MIERLLKCGPNSRMTGDERREQILEAAVKLFSQRGFSGTTTKEVARAAGVSEAMVFKHFGSKEELYAAIIDSRACQVGLNVYPWEADDELKRAIEQKDDFRFFYLFGLRAMEKHKADTDLIRLLFFSALEQHEISQVFYYEFVGRIYEYLSEYISMRQRDGVMKKMEPREVVRLLLGAWIHHSLNDILWDSDRKLLNITSEEAASSFANIVLNGILTRPAAVSEA